MGKSGNRFFFNKLYKYERNDKPFRWNIGGNWGTWPIKISLTSPLENGLKNYYI